MFAVQLFFSDYQQKSGVGDFCFHFTCQKIFKIKRFCSFLFKQNSYFFLKDGKRLAEPETVGLCYQTK